MVANTFIYLSYKADFLFYCIIIFLSNVTFIKIIISQIGGTCMFHHLC